MRIAVALCCAALLAGSASTIDARQAHGTTESHGQTGLTIRIDPQVAAMVRAWRAAHGLDVHAEPDQTAAAEHTAAEAWKRQCREQGGASRVQEQGHDSPMDLCT